MATTTSSDVSVPAVNPAPVVAGTPGGGANPTIDPAVQRNAIAAAERAMAFPISAVLERYERDYKIPRQTVLRHERELKRYLALVGSNPTQRYGMMGPIDHIWHTFVLFTLEYKTFCEKVVGRFVHHVPERDLVPSERTVHAYVTFLAHYELVYGEVAPLDLWPNPKNGPLLANGCYNCACSTSCNTCTVH